MRNTILNRLAFGLVLLIAPAFIGCGDSSAPTDASSTPAPGSPPPASGPSEPGKTPDAAAPSTATPAPDAGAPAPSAAPDAAEKK